jgi:hypothetical protein
VVEIKGSRELECSQGESLGFGRSKLGVVKSREDQDYPSEENRWQRSRDLACRGFVRIEHRSWVLQLTKS